MKMLPYNLLLCLFIDIQVRIHGLRISNKDSGDSHESMWGTSTLSSIGIERTRSQCWGQVSSVHSVKFQTTENIHMMYCMYVCMYCIPWYFNNQKMCRSREAWCSLLLVHSVQCSAVQYTLVQYFAVKFIVKCISLQRSEI